jgi:hypothetical protein
MGSTDFRTGLPAPRLLLSHTGHPKGIHPY